MSEIFIIIEDGDIPVVYGPVGAKCRIIYDNLPDTEDADLLGSNEINREKLLEKIDAGEVFPIF